MYKVLIRPLKIEDASISWKWRNDTEIWKYTGRKPDIVVTEKIEKEWLLNKLKESNSYRFAIEVDNVYVGNIQLTNVIQNENAEYHIFIGDKAFWGRGIATLATRQIIMFAINVLQLKSIYLVVKPENRSAIKVYEKSGFEKINDKVEMQINLSFVTPPAISVFMMAYNHEKYIEEAIEGILMQKTTFDFDVVIGDDCSKDNTRKVLLEYQQRYPSKFKLLLHEQNLGAIANQKAVFDACKGRYIAICEGDDYWIDPYKLQKQVDFLEKNPDYGLVHTDCDILIQHKNKYEKNINKNLNNDIENCSNKEQFQLLINGSYKIRTATVLFKKDLLTFMPQNQPKFLMGDTPMWLVFSQNTKFKYIDESTAVYRVLKGSASHSKAHKNKLRFGLSMAEMRVFYSKFYNFDITESLARRYNNALLLYKIEVPEFKELYSLIEASTFKNRIYKTLDNRLVLFIIKLLVKFYNILDSSFILVKRLLKRFWNLCKIWK